MTELLTTITAMAIHAPDQSPVYGEYTTHISMTDEAGGIFFEVAQDEKTLRLALAELHALVAAAESMLAQEGAKEEGE